MFTPLAVEHGKRVGPREFLLKVQAQHPDRLTIQMNSLAARVFSMAAGQSVSNV